MACGVWLVDVALRAPARGDRNRDAVRDCPRARDGVLPPIHLATCTPTNFPLPLYISSTHSPAVSLSTKHFVREITAPCELLSALANKASPYRLPRPRTTSDLQSPPRDKPTSLPTLSRDPVPRLTPKPFSTTDSPPAVWTKKTPQHE